MEKKLQLVDQTMTTESGCVVSRTRDYDKYINGFGKLGGASLTYALTDAGQNKDVLAKKGLDAVVYEMMIVAAQDVLDLGTTFEGSYTASELAAQTQYGVQMMVPFTNQDYEEYASIGIEAGTLKLSFPADDVFKTMAEWEGVAGITAKQAHRFGCEGKTQPQGVEFKAYKRHRGYHKHMPSYAEDERRIAEKFEALGRISQSLTSDGMRGPALAVLTAAKVVGKQSGYDMEEMAKMAMTKKLWKDYGREGSYPVAFDIGDFDEAPEVWRQVDDGYVKVLLQWFKELLAANPAPKYGKVGRYVQFKNQENTMKKYRGKLFVEGLRGSVTPDAKHICWELALRVGRWKTEYHAAERLGPWVQPAPKKRATKKAAKAAAPQPSHISHQPSAPQPTFAELLRKALLAA